MAKSIFRKYEVADDSNVIKIQLSKTFENKIEETVEEEIPVYTGPNIDDLKREAEEFKTQWEIEKAEIIEAAKKEAEEIIKEAQENAADEFKKQTEQAQTISQKAKEDAETLIDGARKQAEEIIAESEKHKTEIEHNAYDEGFAAGKDAGFKDGCAEVERLISRLHLIIEKTMDKRQDILASAEQQVVDLVLLMTRKVVKVISENQRNVVISNVVHALRKVKGRGDVIIRVNLADVALTTEHIKNFFANVENSKNITVVEDLSTDPGGCIIETDFGAIDARIASQLHELEQKILEISPIKTKPKTARN